MSLGNDDLDRLGGPGSSQPWFSEDGALRIQEASITDLAWYELGPAVLSQGWVVEAWQDRGEEGHPRLVRTSSYVDRVDAEAISEEFERELRPEEWDAITITYVKELGGA